MNITFQSIVAIAALLFCIGLLGVLRRKSLLFMVLSIEMMLNAAAFAFVGAAYHLGNWDGQVMFVIILTVAATEAAIGLALVVQFEKQFKTLEVTAASELKG